VHPPVQAAALDVGVGSSVPTEAARWFDRLQLSEVQIADRPQCFGGRAVLKTVRQTVQPGGILNLGFHEAGDMIGPTPGPSPMIEREAHTDDRFSGRARRDSEPGVRRRSWPCHRSVCEA
jgi:hypothetical protein